MKELTIKTGHVVRLDDKDYERIAQHNWSVDKKGYPRTIIKLVGSRSRSYGTTFRLHQLLLACPEGYKIDHRDRDKLNNQKDNLRLATSGQSNANTGLKSNNTSGYKGIHFDKRANRWYAFIRREGKQKFIGSYLTAVEAAKAYDQQAREVFGEFACLNFPWETL